MALLLVQDCCNSRFWWLSGWLGLSNAVWMCTDAWRCRMRWMWRRLVTVVWCGDWAVSRVRYVANSLGGLVVCDCWSGRCLCVSCFCKPFIVTK